MSIISSIVESVIGKLGEVLIQPLYQEAIFLHGVSHQVQLLKDEFRAMQSFLEDADAKQLVDQSVKTWVQEVREAANEAEDAIDIFTYKIAPLRQAGFLGKLKRYAFIFAELKALHELGKKIKDINVKITEITRRRKTYDIKSISAAAQGEATGSSETQSLRRHPPLHVPEPDFVGLKELLSSLIDHLIKRERRRCAVSLVGMGGLGKTTLARKAYNHEAVVNCFSCRAWVSVSQQYSVRELLLTIAKQCCVCSVDELQRMAASDLSSKISEYLGNRRYLIVLDDIRERRAWDDLKHAFPDESNGSRILLTTRIEEVARYADVRSKPYELPFLKEDESWQLFCKKAFPGEEGCPLPIEPIGREIVKKCSGLPLAIVVMGGLLLTKKKEASEWQKVLDSIHWQFGQGEYPVLEILSLSYYHLPYSIKPCFLYLAIFPEDYNFPADRLIRLWAAEGFLQQRGHETLEEVGEDILMDLISRNLIQVAGTSSSGLIESCRIHDLLRDLCVSKAAEEEFIEVHPWSSTAPSVCKGRRLARHGKKASEFSYLNSRTRHHHLRSFLFDENQNGEMLETRQIQLLFTSFKMLRVLDLDQVLIREIPSEIGKLFHLRYLRCSNTRIKSLPSSTANLLDLQTLDVVRQGVNRVLHIPSPVMKMLQGLRHLRVFTNVASSRRRGRLRNLKPFLSKNLFDIIRNVNGFVSYGEWVGLEGTNKSSLVSELCFIDKSFISASSSFSMLQRPLRITSSHSFIDGILSKLPDQPWDFPSKLSKLELIATFLEMDPLPLLEKLENLRFLIFDPRSYEGKEMVCSSGGFPQLQSLHLRRLLQFEGWRVEAGAMPCLSHLLIDDCCRLKMLPEGLKYLTKLKTLEIKAMPPTFMDRIRAGVGEDWYNKKWLQRGLFLIHQYFGNSCKKNVYGLIPRSSYL